MKQIAARLGVSPGSVHLWTKDIQISPEHTKRNLGRSRARFVETWREKHRKRRRGYQQQGRERARQGDPLHMGGCLLYWAEGAKARNGVCFVNSDPMMLRYFLRFLRECFDLGTASFTIRLNVYLEEGRPIEAIEDHWLSLLDLPRSCLRGHTINHFPTSTSGRKKNRLPFGVCSLKVLKSTWLVQHIFGAIQEYGGFSEPRWLDCDPVRGPASPR